MKDIRHWLGTLGLAEYARAFEDNAIDFRALPSLTENDLKELGLKLGHRRILQQAIAALVSEASTSSGTSPPDPRSSLVTSAPERRQLTVMFCDLVGSVDLGERMDVEDYRELLGRFRETVTEAVKGHTGFIARHQGDGLLAYFGYPHAREDDAERAVRAGLDVVQAVESLRLPFEIALRVRVGIATGPVIVGDLLSTGQSPEVAALGSTPNLAARLQGSAQPNTVLVSELTARLIRSWLPCEPVALELKGFEAPVTAFVVGREVAAGSRPYAGDAAAPTPFVGRGEELALLTARWRRAREGEGQVVLLSGEPGVGKSRLVREYIDVVGHGARRLVTLHGSPYHQGSPLHPVLARLEQALAIPANSSAETSRHTIDAWLTEQGLDAEALGPWFAAFLSPQHDPGLDPAVQKRYIQDALLTWLVEGQVKPALIMVEDAHWLDPSTVDLLGELIEHVRDQQALLLITHRTEFLAPWGDPGHQTTVALKGLSRSEVTSLARLAAGHTTLPEATLQTIVEHADGFPLFAEELTRSVIEEDTLPSLAGAQRSSPPVPATLRDSLMARLDRLGAAKYVAQAASVVGRSFTAMMLAKTLDVGEDGTHSQLALLVRSGLVQTDRGQGGDAYVFKHALVCDAAYESMLTSQRRELHGRLASALAEEFERTKQTEPELLAHHYTEAGIHQTALEYWLAAGKRAAEQAAYPEAVAHLAHGLAQIDSLPDGPGRARREIALRVALGVPLMKQRSVASQEVGENYRRARDLCEEFGEGQERFPVLWGQWYHHMLRFEVRRACELADELLVTGKSLADGSLELEAHHCQWASRFLTGDLEATLEHADQGLGLYRPEAHHPLMFIYGGHDPGVCAYDVGALTLWLLGYSQQAQKRLEMALELARKLAQPSTLANTMSKALALAGFRCDVDAMAYLGEELLGFLQGDSAEQSRPHAIAALGWVSFERGRREEGLAQMREAVRNGLIEDPWNIYIVSMIATVLGTEGAVDEGLNLVNEALGLSQKNDVNWWVPELFRVKGELVRLEGGGNLPEVELWLERAMATARSRQARSLQLRAAVSLARHWGERGMRGKARALLVPEVEWFSDKLDNVDLEEANALLERLS